MKLLRHGQPGSEKPGYVDASGVMRDLSPLVEQIDPSLDALRKLQARIEQNRIALPEIPAHARIGSPVPRPGKVVCVGMNYADHCKEAGVPVPTEPALFMKASTSVCGPNDDVELPVGATRLDYEVELAVVIGRKAKNISADQVRDHLLGYVILNDISERAFQLDMGGQWMKGKCHDTFAPVGPWLVTADEVRDDSKLILSLNVNGKSRQIGSTSSLVFGVAQCVSYISRFMTLEPGDIVSTGTPPGVAMGRPDKPWLQPGDVIEAQITGLGQQRNHVVDLRS